MNTFSAADEGFMRRALELAERGEGRVSPNPPVGCVLVRDGAVVAGGWHDRLGGLHAEAMALKNAGDGARGATAYVTLSPCTTRGRQPPCADALIRAGVGRVVVAAPDPNPGNANGVDVLNRAGIPASAGLLREDAEYLARGFFKCVRTGLPHVTLKYAMTLDGKTAASTGDSKWISGPASRAVVQDMRSRADAVLAGIGTALADDPLLNVRGEVWETRSAGAADGGGHRQPLRVVVDSRCRLPAAAAMLDARRNPGGKVVVATIAGEDDPAAVALRGAGAEVWHFAPRSGAGAGGGVPLRPLLVRLAEAGVNMVLAECGSTLAAALVREGLVDEAAAFVAPKFIGGAGAPGPLGDLGLGRMADALPLRIKECRFVENDIMLTVLLARE